MAVINSNKLARGISSEMTKYTDGIIQSSKRKEQFQNCKRFVKD